MAVSQKRGRGTNIIAGTSGGGVHISTDNGTSWSSVGPPDLDVVALAVSGSYVFAGTNGRGIFVSTDNGARWDPASVDPNVHVFGFAVGRNKDGRANIFAGTYGAGIYQSTDNGSSWWAPVKNDEEIPREIWCLVFRGKSLYAGTRTSTFVSSDDGANWEVIESVNDIHALVVAPGGGRGRNLFAGSIIGTGVWLSAGENAGWKKVNTGLANRFVWSLAAATDRNGKTSIFAGTEDGIFRSINNGKRWTPVNGGLANRNVRSIAVAGSYIFVGTWGDGVWRRPLSDLASAER